MKTKKNRNVGSHIKVQALRNGEMRAVRGGTEYTCGDGDDDDCRLLRVVTALAEKPGLLTIMADVVEHTNPIAN